MVNVFTIGIVRSDDLDVSTQCVLSFLCEVSFDSHNVQYWDGLFVMNFIESGL